MKANPNYCFMCNNEIKGKLYRCTDKNMCSEKCCIQQFNYIKDIDPYLTNPSSWNDSTTNNEDNDEYNNNYEDMPDIIINKENDETYKDNLDYLSLYKKIPSDRLLIYIYLFIGIVRCIIY